jgi:hypothetical protein
MAPTAAYDEIADWYERESELLEPVRIMPSSGDGS